MSRTSKKQGYYHNDCDDYAPQCNKPEPACDTCRGLFLSAGDVIPLDAIGRVQVRLKDGTDEILGHGYDVPEYIDGYVIFDACTKKMQFVPGPMPECDARAAVQELYFAGDVLPNTMLGSVKIPQDNGVPLVLHSSNQIPAIIGAIHIDPVTNKGEYINPEPRLDEVQMQRLLAQVTDQCDGEIDACEIKDLVKQCLDQLDIATDETIIETIGTAFESVTPQGLFTVTDASVGDGISIAFNGQFADSYTAGDRISINNGMIAANPYPIVKSGPNITVTESMVNGATVYSIGGSSGAGYPSIVTGGDGVTVSSDTSQTTGQVTYTVNADAGCQDALALDYAGGVLTATLQKSGCDPVSDSVEMTVIGSRSVVTDINATLSGTTLTISLDQSGGDTITDTVDLSSLVGAAATNNQSKICMVGVSGDVEFSIVTSDGSDYEVAFDGSNYETFSSGAAASHTYTDAYTGPLLIKAADGVEIIQFDAGTLPLPAASICCGG